MSRFDTGGYIGAASKYPTVIPEAPTVLTGTYVGTDTDASNGTGSHNRTYSFTGVTVAAEDTLVIVTGNQSSSGDYHSMVSATIDSTSATEAAVFSDAASYVTEADRYTAGIFYVTGVTASTVSVSVACTGSDVFRSWCNLYKITGGVVAHSDTDGQNAASQSSFTATVDCPAGGVIIAGYGDNENGSFSGSWSGLTQDVAGVTELYHAYTSAHAEFPSGATAEVITVTPSATNDGVLVVASFGAT